MSPFPVNRKYGARIFGALALLAATPAVAGAGPICPQVTLFADLSPDLRSIRGTLHCRAARDGELSVATYPRILAEPRGLDDVNRHWLYPEGFDPAGMDLAHQQPFEPLEGSGSWQPLGRVVAGQQIALAFTTRVPRRNGSFGLHRGIAFLLGGWHPAFGDGAAIDRATIDYQISIPGDRVGFVGDKPFGRNARQPSRRIRGTFAGRFVPLLASPQLAVEPGESGIIITPIPARPTSHGGQPAWQLADVTAHYERGAEEELRKALDAALEFAQSVGVKTKPLLVVRAPLQSHLAESFDGGFAVSDRAFHLLPIERLLKFHRIATWRAQLAGFLEPIAVARESQLPATLIADLLACALRDRLVHRRYGGEEYAPELLETFAVIPEIDALIFAPQIPLADAYFDAIDESPTERLRLDNFADELPRGKLLYEKLIDALGQRRVQQLVDDYLAGSRSFTAMLDETTEGGGGRLLAPWLGPYPEIDYAIGQIREQGGALQVEVTASGPAAEGEQPLREPISVLLEDATGKEHRVTRVGPGTVEIDAPGPPARVEIDPDGRLVELHRQPGEAARFNNRTPPRWRFLLNNITGLVAVTGGEITASADFSLRRIHDLRYRFDFFAQYSASSLAAGSSVGYAFGEEITPLRLAHRISAAASYQRLRQESAEILPGDQVSLGLYYGYDSRLSPYWAFEGQGLSAQVVTALGRDVEGGRYEFIQAGAGGLKILPLALGHALVGRARGDIQLGNAPPQNGLRLGGRYRGGRGFERDALRGDLRLLVSGEYRHTLVADGRTDLFGLFTFTRLEGALFADAIYLRAPGKGCGRELYYDAGYGIRFIGDILNVAPGSLQIDLGVPLSTCDSRPPALPFAVYVAFVQSFASF